MFFLGNIQVKIEIAAQDSMDQFFVLYPLVCGFVALPKLRLVAFPDTPEAMSLDEILDDILPSFMNIMVSVEKCGEV